jgi:hypothetical protein
MHNYNILRQIFECKLLDGVKRFHNWSPYFPYCRVGYPSTSQLPDASVFDVVLDLGLAETGQRLFVNDRERSLFTNATQSIPLPYAVATQLLAQSARKNKCLDVAFQDATGASRRALALFPPSSNDGSSPEESSTSESSTSESSTEESSTESSQAEWYYLYHLAGPLAFSSGFRPHVEPGDMAGVQLHSSFTRKMHWLWYRRPGALFPRKYARRAATWLAMNPELEYHLWTDMADSTEFAAFLAEADPGDARLLLERTRVHGRDSLRAEVVRYLEEHRPQDTYAHEHLPAMLDRSDPYDMIVKTDVIRVVVVYLNGGFYADMNDCVALQPLRFLWPDAEPTDPGLLLGSDSHSGDINNYFFHSPAGHPVLKRALDKMMAMLPHVIHALRQAHSETLPMYTATLKALVARLKTKAKPESDSKARTTSITKVVALDELGDCYREVFRPEAERSTAARPLHTRHTFVTALYPDHLKVLIWLLGELEDKQHGRRSRLQQRLEQDFLASGTLELGMGGNKASFVDPAYDPLVSARLLVSGSDGLKFDASLIDAGKYRRYFTNNTQGLSMIYTNLGIVVNHLNHPEPRPRGVNVLHNCYMYRGVSLLSCVSHIGTGSASGDATSDDKSIV